MGESDKRLRIGRKKENKVSGHRRNYKETVSTEMKEITKEANGE